MTIYEIDEAIMNCIDPETGEVDGDQIEALMFEREKKIDNIVRFIFKLTADIDTAKKEIDRIQTIKRINENTVEKLKELLQTSLKGEKIKTATYSISYRRSTAVVIDNEDAIPGSFLCLKTTPDKKAIKEYLQDGAEIAGAHLEDRENIIIK